MQLGGRCSESISWRRTLMSGQLFSLTCAPWVCFWFRDTKSIAVLVFRVFSPPLLISVALLSWITAPEFLCHTSLCSGHLTAALRCWRASSRDLSHHMNGCSEPCTVFVLPAGPAAGWWALLLAGSAASRNVASEPGLEFIQHPKNYINRPWTEKQKWPYLNSMKLMAMTLPTKNTEGEYFSCFVFFFGMERQKNSYIRRTLNQPLK